MGKVGRNKKNKTKKTGIGKRTHSWEESADDFWRGWATLCARSPRKFSRQSRLDLRLSGSEVTRRREVICFYSGEGGLVTVLSFGFWIVGGAIDPLFRNGAEWGCGKIRLGSEKKSREYNSGVYPVTMKKKKKKRKTERSDVKSMRRCDFLEILL